jgi:hypothetical protein
MKSSSADGYRIALGTAALDVADAVDTIVVKVDLWGSNPPNAAKLAGIATATTTGLVLGFPDGGLLDIRGAKRRCRSMISSSAVGYRVTLGTAALDFANDIDTIVLEADLWGTAPPDSATLLATATVTTAGLVLGLPDGGLLDIRGGFGAALLVDDIKVR